MRNERITAAAPHGLGSSILLAGSVFALAAAYLLVELHAPLNHDVAWLLDAGSRWTQGQRLYVDIVELNPPLIFYVYAGLTLGTFDPALLVGGVVALMVASSLWAARLNGPRWGVATFVICAASGAIDFGQRDHLAAIVAIPYLWADRAGARERALIGAWSFVGFGLKPYLMLIPACATLARMVRDRSLAPAVAPENIVLILLSLVYVAATAVVYPDYLTSMVPLAQLVYFAYGAGFAGEPVTLPLLAWALATAIAAATQRRLWPQVGALAGAVASYLVQGRFWTYHLVPAVALTFVLLLMIARDRDQRRRWVLTLVVIAALGAVLFGRFRRQYEDLIPQGATSVLFLSAHLGSAYPAAVDRRIVHASRFPAMWTLPGASRRLRDPGSSAAVRSRAVAVLAETRGVLVDDILRYCPDPICADVRPRKPYFDGPFDFIAFLSADPRFSGYRAGEKIGMFRLYRRVHPCPRKQAVG